MSLAVPSAEADDVAPASPQRRTTRARINTFLRRHWLAGFPVLASFFVFRAWLDPSTLIAGGDFPSFPDSIIGSGGWPHLWMNLRFGFSLLYWAGSSPLFALGGDLRGLGAGFPVVERAIWLWPYMLGAPLCGYFLCYRFTRSSAGATVGATLFAINTWTVGLVERGHIPSLESYMLFGLLLPAILAFTARPSRSMAFTIAALLSLQMIFDLRYAYEGLLILFLAGVLALPRLAHQRDLVAFGTSVACLGFAFVALNLDVVLPMLLSPRLPSGWISPEAFAQISHFGSLLGAFALYFPFYHYLAGADGFAETNTEVSFLIVAFAAWFGLLLARRRRAARFLLLIATLGVIFVSGTRGPFSWLDEAIFEHVPGFVLFRDFSKFDAFIAIAYAVGLASLVATLAALLRRKLVGSRGLLVPLALLSSAAYMLVMRDAVNPLRQSNFAPAAQPTQGGLATDQFLLRNLGDARVLMFPGDVRWQRRERFIPMAEAGDIASLPPPLGFADFNPGIDTVDSVLQLFASPLAPSLLRELRVKYVLVPDDRGLYYAFDERPPRWSCIDFLREQSWIKQVATFGDNVLFEIAGAPVEPAFFAPYPALVLGSPATLEGLVDSPLGGDHAAAMLVDQMPANAEWIASVPNIVRGPTLIDPGALLGPGDAIAAAKRLNDANAAERYKRRAYAADVFSSAMLTRSMLHWNFESPFAFRFQTTLTDRMRARFLLERRKKIPSVLIRNSGRVSAFSSSEDATILSSGAACNPAAVWQGQFDASVPTIGVAASDPRKALFVDNPCPIAYVGTLSLRLLSGDALPQSVSLSFGNVTRTVIAPPAWFGLAGSGTVKLSDVVLRPGLNLLSLSKSATRPVSVSANYRVADLHGLGGAFRPYPLQLSVRHSQAGDLIYASIDVPRAGMHIGYVDLFGPLDLPLDTRPVCTFKYTMSHVPGSFSLVLDLRKRDTGETLSFWVPMERVQSVDYDIADVVRNVLRENFDRELRYHADDPLWTARHFAEGVASPDDFTLRSIRIAATWSVFESSDVPRGTFMALMRGLRLATSSQTIGARWAYPQTDLINTERVNEDNFTLRGMKVLRISARGAEGGVDAQLAGFTPSGYRLATSLHVGDYVQLALQNDKSIAGTIVAESSDYVLVQDGDAPPQRVARGSISTVSQQEITRSAKLEVPISSPFEPTQLSFSVRSEEALKVRIGLVYQDANGSRDVVPAIDRDESDDSGIDVEPDFVKPAILTGGTVFDLSVPIDLTLAQPPLARWMSYDIDLWGVERYRFGDSRHRLVALTLEFTQLPNLSADRQFSVALADLMVTRDQLFTGDVAQTAVNRPLATLDGTAVAAPAVHVSAESSGFFTAESEETQLGAGSHVIQSKALDEIRVRAVTLSRGSATTFLGGRVSRLDDVSPSEQSGSLNGAGVMVDSRTFDPGWALALWPPGSEPPALTGFALYDFIRIYPQLVPSRYHVPVNTGIDAWYVPPGASGERRFVTLYTPEAYCELGALLSLIVLLLFAAEVTCRRIAGVP